MTILSLSSFFFLYISSEKQYLDYTPGLEESFGDVEGDEGRQ